MGKYDKWMLLVTILLTGFGALMIYSCTSVITPVYAKKGVTEFYYFKRHMFTILIGFLFLFFSFKLELSFLKRARYSPADTFPCTPGPRFSAGHRRICGRGKEMDTTLAIDVPAF